MDFCRFRFEKFRHKVFESFGWVTFYGFSAVLADPKLRNVS